MAKIYDPHRLSNPGVFLLSMMIFLIIIAFIAAILYNQISAAFATNPGLNGLILGVLGIGILLALLQAIRLIPEVNWVNSFRQGDPYIETVREPVLLAPMKAVLGEAGPEMTMSTQSWRSLLDSVGNRLDEARDISRYLIALLVFLGLLGTFWGLLATIGSLGDTIQSLDPRSGDVNDVMDALKSGLSAPLAGMGKAFSSSLFGLAGSLVLGFLDLQAGRAQNRFYIELENWLSTVIDKDIDLGSTDKLGFAKTEEIHAQLSRLARTVQEGGTGNERAIKAMADFAENINGLVQYMRSDQEVLKQYLEGQSQQMKETRELLKKMSKVFDKAARK